jgi:uncharacterized surface protein with fasciclin (FAS1) repeats
MKRLFSLTLATIVVTFGLTACSDLTSNLDEDAILSAEEAALRPGTQTIAEIVIGAAGDEDEPQFTLLLAALQYADLAGVFAGGGQYTVFAPTDAAFGALVNAVAPLLDADILEDDGVFAAIDALLYAEYGVENAVASVLLYHVAEGRRAANSVVPRRGTRTIETLLGATFLVNPDLEITAIGNTANIIDANLSAKNGVIHVIDAVILPLEL